MAKYDRDLLFTYTSSEGARIVFQAERIDNKQAINCTVIEVFDRYPNTSFDIGETRSFIHLSILSNITDEDYTLLNGCIQMTIPLTL